MSGIHSIRSFFKNPFERARWRLTILFSATIMFVVALFSIWLVASLEQNVWNSLDDQRLLPLAQRVGIFHQTAHEIEENLLILDVSLFFLSLLIGYLIASRVLEPIRKSTEMQKRFFTDVSHDLRTPLAIMKSEAQVAFSGVSSKEDYKEVIMSVLEEVDKMSSYIDQLMLIAKSDSPDVAFVEKDVVDLHLLTLPIVHKFLPRAEERKQTLSLVSSPGNFIWGNNMQLERSLVNIVSNALKYTPVGGVIEVSIKRQSKKVIFTVKDTGCGISKDDIPQIFDRFYKAEHSRKEGTGFGLGLSIAKQFVEINEGRITIESEPAKGTSVSIVFPLHDPKKEIS